MKGVIDMTWLKTLKVGVCSAAAALFGYLQAITVPLVMLLVAVSCDYVSGMIAAFSDGTLSSRKGKLGILKKLSYLIVIVAAALLDWILIKGMQLIGQNIEIRPYYLAAVVCIWLILNEIISILENLTRIGVPLPSFLSAIAKRLKQQTDKIKEDETNE